MHECLSIKTFLYNMPAAKKAARLLRSGLGDEVFVGPNVVSPMTTYPCVFNPEWKITRTRIDREASRDACKPA
jgi:hypothetical protein